MNCKTLHAALIVIALFGASSVAMAFPKHINPEGPTPQPLPADPASNPAPAAPVLDAATIALARGAIQRGVDNLLAHQEADGAWSGDPAITALAVLALYQSHATENRERIDEAVEKGLRFILSHQQKDGSICKNGRYGSYTSSISLATLAVLNRPQDQAAMLKIRHFLIDMQLDEDHPYTPVTDSSIYKGGFSYGAPPKGGPGGGPGMKNLTPEQRAQFAKMNPHLNGQKPDSAFGPPPGKSGPGMPGGKRPPSADLSNTHLALEALKMTDHLENESTPEAAKWKEKSDLAWENALAFVEHCQHMPDSVNQENWLVLSQQDSSIGGFVYRPKEPDTNQGSTTKGLRSYGSMTYAGVKSMIYAKLNPEDYRVKAARNWIAQHYTMDENPELGSEGLYYYYHTCSKANSVLQDTFITDAKGVRHNWRLDLIQAILKREQKKTGSWVNDNGRWMESLPTLASCYTLLSLELALENVK